MNRITACLAVALGMGVAATAQAAKAPVKVPHRYDGSWGIEAVTGQGPCPGVARYSVTIREGNASLAGVADVTVTGSVSPSGMVRGTIVSGSVRLPVEGRLEREGTGTGVWRTEDGSPVACSGRWTARRSA